MQYFWQGDDEIYGHIWCIYTVLANPTDFTEIFCVILKDDLPLVSKLVSKLVKIRLHRALSHQVSESLQMHFCYFCLRVHSFRG